MRLVSGIPQCKGDNRFAVQMVRDIEGGIACRLLRGEGGVEFGSGDLLGCRRDEAELAGRKIAFSRAHRRSEGTTDNRARCVQITGPGDWIENRTGLVIADAFFVGEEGRLFISIIENASDEIAWEEWCDASERIDHTSANTLRCRSITVFKCAERIAEA